MKLFFLNPQLPTGIRISRGVLAMQSVTMWIGGMSILLISWLYVMGGAFLGALFFVGIAALPFGIGGILWWFGSKLHRIFDKWGLSTLIAELALILLGVRQLAIDNQDTGNPFLDGVNGFITLSGLLFVIGGFLVIILFIWEFVWKIFQNHTK